MSLIVAADLSQRLRSALEFGAAVGLIVVLTALASSRFNEYILHAQVAEAFSVTSTLRPELVLYRAQHGHWPASATDLPHSELEAGPEYQAGRYVDRVDLLDDGTLSAVFDSEHSRPRLANRRLAFRPQTHADDPGAPVVWTCGNFDPVPGLSMSGSNTTDITPADLPSICRGK